MIGKPHEMSIHLPFASMEAAFSRNDKRLTTDATERPQRTREC